ncbi:response regulator [Massilia sp. FT127W]|uniref:Response regulator n=2 Tax=Pseudoduganella aquatica TaxID=2660641 RepID=A0A7X4HA90_9BURK|nr:response regulator [Pseudoduganella aquatica]
MGFTAGRASQPARLTAGLAAGVSALTIEPHPGMRASLHNMLNLCGVTRIEDASSSGQAIRMLSSKTYDIVLCEYCLDGGQDGQQMLEDLRHHRLIQPATLFFMVTGEGQFNKVVSAAELQPNDYILKPFTADNMLERIARAFDKRQALSGIHQLVALGDQRGAIAACLDGEQQQPRYVADFQRLRAELHMELGEPELAEPIYAELYASKNIHWARLGQAKCLFLQGLHSESQAMLGALVEQNKRFLDAYDWLARTHEVGSDWSGAQAVLSEAVELSPHAVRRLRRLGEVALEAGDLDAAEQAWKQVVSKARYSEFRDPEDHARLVSTLVRKGDPVQAAAVIRDLDKSLAGQRNTAVCSAISSAMLHEYTGNQTRLDESIQFALAGCRRATGLSNDLRLDLARTCLEGGKPEQAAEVLRGVMRNAGNPAAMAKAMRVLEDAGQGELAQQLAAESRQEVVDMVAVGAARAKEGDYKGAVELMMEAVAKLPDNGQVVFNAAVAVLKCLENTGWDGTLGQDALNLIASVRRLDPSNPKLGALSALHQDILKKYNIRAGRLAAI